MAPQRCGCSKRCGVEIRSRDSAIGLRLYLLRCEEMRRMEFLRLLDISTFAMDGRRKPRITEECLSIVRSMVYGPLTLKRELKTTPMLKYAG